MKRLERLRVRAAFFRLLRRFFEEEGFLEVDTPVRQPTLIPETHIVPIKADGGLLQASPELCMKRLLAEGAERIFQICPCFRKEERGRLHSEEFLLLEWYRRDADYHQLMEDCQALVRFLNKGFAELGIMAFPGVDVEARWQRMSVEEAFEKYAPISLFASLADGFFDEVLVEYVEPYLGASGTPLFLYDYPLELGSLAREKISDNRFVERFELYIGGVEIANGFSELADSSLQRGRFEREISEIEQIRGERVLMPEKFLTELPEMGNAAGIALGVDRLLMLLVGETTLAEIQTFSWEEL